MSDIDDLRQIIARQIATKRDAALRARRLANEFWNATDRDTALRFAEEMDAQADELERGLEGPSANDKP